MNYFLLTNPDGRPVSGLWLRSLSVWDCGFESLLEQGRLSLFNAVSFHVEITARGQLLVNRSRSECGVSECDREASLIW